MVEFFEKCSKTESKKKKIFEERFDRNQEALCKGSCGERVARVWAATERHCWKGIKDSVTEVKVQEEREVRKSTCKELKRNEGENWNQAAESTFSKSLVVKEKGAMRKHLKEEAGSRRNCKGTCSSRERSQRREVNWKYKQNEAQGNGGGWDWKDTDGVIRIRYIDLSMFHRKDKLKPNFRWVIIENACRGRRAED